jgi:hypothetical protein
VEVDVEVEVEVVEEFEFTDAEFKVDEPEKEGLQALQSAAVMINVSSDARVIKKPLCLSIQRGIARARPAKTDVNSVCVRKDTFKSRH